MTSPYQFSLVDRNRQRKYLNPDERKRFYRAANQEENHKRLFFLMLYYTGARISEILVLKKEHIDQVEKMVTLQSLKKRNALHFRSIPLPDFFIKELKEYSMTISGNQLWPFSRRTASRYISATMREADIHGIHACAKGLRHSFAVCAAEHNVPLNLIKDWMGHSSIATTTIYLQVVGKEERQFAKRMW